MITGLTKSQVKNLAEFIEINFINSIRDDDDLDNIDYVVDMMQALVALRETAEAMKSEELVCRLNR